MSLRDHLFIEQGGAAWIIGDVLLHFTAQSISGSAGSHSIGAYGPSGSTGYRVALALNSSAPMENRISKTLGGGRAFGRQSFWFRDSNTSDGKVIAEVRDVNTVQLALYRNTDGTVSVFLGPDRYFPALTTLQTSSASFAAGSHHHIEWQWSIDSTSAGWVIVWIDGSPSPAINFTGVTSYSGNSYWNNGSWGHSFSNNAHTTLACNLDYSHMLLSDDLSGLGTGQLGAGLCGTRFKKIGATGRWNDWTNVGGADIGTSLRDASGQDGDTSYGHTSTGGNKQSGPMDDVTAAFVSVLVSQLTSIGKINGVGTSLITQGWRVDSVDTLADSGQAIVGSYGAIRDVAISLNGNPLSKAVLNAEEPFFQLG